MVKDISINNFKSIIDFSFEAKRINVFIGEPDAGKSNILEALSLFSIAYYDEVDKVVRYETVTDLFSDGNTDNAIDVKADDINLSLSYKSEIRQLTVVFNQGDKEYSLSYDKHVVKNSDGIKTYADLLINGKMYFKPYRFIPVDYYTSKYEKFLFPPEGKNLIDIVRRTQNLREFISNLFKSKGYKLNINLDELKLNISKELNDIIYSYPYSSISDTLQRIIFYFAAIESNQDSVLLFEEPEANTFPYYTKQLAERIALDQNNNQFFIATHNPYLLSSIVEKTSISDLAVNIVYMQDYKTQLYQLTDDQLSEVLDLGPDVFYNLDRFLPDA